MVDVSDEYLHEAQGLIYRQWTIAFDNHKAVKAEKDDGTKDWQQFHVIRLETATKELAKWTRLKNESIPISPLTRKG